MKKAFILLLMAIAYLATFILGAASGAIHPACYAYAGAVLPLLTALIYLYTTTLLRNFGAATLLNGFILVLFLIAGEACIEALTNGDGQRRLVAPCLMTGDNRHRRRLLFVET